MFTFSGSIIGQTKLDGWSISPKFGAFLKTSQEDPTTGFMVGIEGNIMKNNFLYSANYYYGDEWIITGSGPDRVFNQSAFLFGRYNTCKFFRFDYQAGLAAIWGTKYAEYHSEGFLQGYYDTENYSTIGIVMKVGGEFVLTKYYSMGSHIQMNLNKEMPRIELVLSFSFGKLKE